MLLLLDGSEKISPLSYTLQGLTAIKRRNQISPVGLSLCITIPYLSFIPYIVVHILFHFFPIRKKRLDIFFQFFFFRAACLLLDKSYTVSSQQLLLDSFCMRLARFRVALALPGEVR